MAGRAAKADRITEASNPERLLADLAAGEPIVGRALVLAAHPDDETLSAGGRLAGFSRLTLVHLTDGAPLDASDANAAGYASRQAYAAARDAELEAALAVLVATPRRIGLGVTDQMAVFALADLTRRLAVRLAQVDVVLTHAYEGGHPDHDAAAFVVQSACALLPSPPMRLEFAGYHAGPDGRVCGAFWPDGTCATAELVLDGAPLARKRAALAAVASQAAVIAGFDPAREAYRVAPRYDFTAPPPPGRALYDDWGWSLTSAAWRAEATAALAELGLGP
jgi:LmbE family N-acetylglucosaminyl deacetylase